MFRQASRNLMPILSAPCKKMVHTQHPRCARSLWDLARPADLRTMVREMDRQMERFEREIFDQFPLRRLVPRSIPIEGNEAVPYRVGIDVSGFKPEEINVAVKDKTLTIRAKMERTAEDGSKFLQEVSRVITLPDNVKASELKSFLNSNGVLTIEAPLQPPEKPKEIPVSSEGENKSISSN